MALPDLTGQNIENTYQRVIQTDGTNFYDGTGSLVNFGGAVFPYTGSAIISGSLEVIGDIKGSPQFQITAGGTNTSLAIGSGSIVNTGTGRSIAIGVDATSTTYDEISIGYNAGHKGSGNPSSAVYIGNNSGNGGAGNGLGQRIGIGHGTLSNNSGRYNVAIGDQAGRFGSGEANVMIGSSAGYQMQAGTQNVVIGQSAGNGSSGNGNIALGYVSNGGDGNYNIALGYRAGNASMTGTNNVLIGYYAGNTFTSESNKLIITSGSSALVTGDFANNTFNISGSVSASTYYGDGSNLTGIETDPFPYTGSAAISGSLEVTGDVTIYGTASVNVLITNYESSSIIYSSGSTKFGDSLDDTHIFTGSVSVTGSLDVDNTITAVTGSFSHLKGNSPITVQDPVFFQQGLTNTGSAIISGSLEVTGDTNITGSGNLNISGKLNTLGIRRGGQNNGGIWLTGDVDSNGSTGNYQIRIGDSQNPSTSGNYNIYIGYGAGQDRTGQGNTVLGTNAGSYGYNTGIDNTLIGRNAGQGRGNYNTMLGYGAGGFNASLTPTYNTFLGYDAGGSNLLLNNITIGTTSGKNATGDYNILLGYESGRYSTGSNNIILGYQAGYNLTGSNQLIIANNSSSALVTGDFANNTFNISGSVSASTYYGDGSNLTGISSDPFPYTGSAVISGSLEVIGDITTNTLSNISTTLASDSATNVDTFNTASYTGAIYDYILIDATVGTRAGQFMVAQDNGGITFTDTSTQHLTDPVIPEISAQINGADVEVQVTNGNGYTFKSFVKKL